MWKPFLISCCLLMLRSAAGQLSVIDLEKMLLASLSSTTTTTTTTPNPLLQKYKLCDHESGEEARCVKKSLCNVAGPPLDPATQFNFRELDEAGACKFLQTCCPESQINLEKVSLPLVMRPVGCGYSNPGATVLRELGSDSGYADYGEFSWMVALMKKNVDDTVFHDAYIAGGALIDPSVVLTVAHKVDEINASNMKVRAGEWDTKSTDESFGYQERDVKKIIIHANFFKLHAHYDFALIILEKPFDLGSTAPHIGVACLERTLPPPGTQCYSMGWGKIASTEKYADLLKKIPLPLVDGDSCQNKYRNSKLGRNYKLHRSLTCAGGVPKVDTCLGDGGSPLVCPIPDKMYMRYSVVGMVVYGLDCGSDLPGVYAKVPEVYDWVQNTLVLEGFTTTPFKKD